MRLELNAFPKNTPGRTVCYCDDCQSYLHHLGRADLLDTNGGTEIIPTYPADVKILEGKEHLKCVRLSPKGMFRFSTSCCNTPIANMRPKTPWIGFFGRMFTVKDPNKLEQNLGPVRCRIMGRFAKGSPPAGTPKAIDLKAMLSVMPHILKGLVLKKSLPSPFFAEDGVTSIASPHVLSQEERRAALKLAGF